MPSFGALDISKNFFAKSAKLYYQEKAQKNQNSAFVDQFSRMNYRSTDSNGGFQCYMSNAATNYLDQDYVRKALHIPEYVQKWSICRLVEYGSRKLPILGSQKMDA